MPDRNINPFSIEGQMITNDNYQKVLDRIFLVSDKLIVFDGIDDVYEHVIKTSIILSRADAATIRVFNMEKGTLDIVKGYGLSNGFLSQPPVRIGEGISGKVVREGKFFSAIDVKNVPEFVKKEIAGLDGIKAVISVPLKIKDVPTGCLNVYKKKAVAFAEHDLLSLNTIASQIAGALEKTRLIQELQKQVAYDQLTGIYNKNTMLKHCEAQINLSARHEQPMSIIFIDIDNFKVFNDTHGHLLGDKLLSDFAKVMKKCCRKSDMIGRFGGEEFVMIASQTTKEHAYVLCNKLKTSMKKHKFTGSAKKGVNITFSAGISSFPEDGSAVDELLKKADQAMYKSKKAGKDTITLY